VDVQKKIRRYKNHTKSNFVEIKYKTYATIQQQQHNEFNQKRLKSRDHRKKLLFNVNIDIKGKIIMRVY
jgi:hypothetical protein